MMENCDSRTLAKLERTCRAFRGERPPPSLIQRAVRGKLRNQFHGATAQQRSWPSLLRPIATSAKEAMIMSGSQVDPISAMAPSRAVHSPA